MTSHLHLTVPLPSGAIAEVVAINGENEIHSDSIRVDGREILMLIDGDDRNAVEQSMWDARMALCFTGTNMLAADESAERDDKCAGCKLGPASSCNAECGRPSGFDDDGQPDEQQEWADYDRDC